MGIYVTIEGKENGPYVEEETRHFLNSGDFMAEDLARREGETELKPLRELLAVTAPPSASAGRRIYVTIEGKENGPYEEAEVRHFLQTGDFLAEDLARRESETTLAPLGEVLATPLKARAVSASGSASRIAPNQARFSEPQRPDGPSGVGGWLLLFCISLVFGVPWFTLMQTLVTFENASPALKAAPSLRGSLYLATFINVIVAGLGIYVGVTIWKGDPNGRTLARRFLRGKLLIELLGAAFFLARCLAIPENLPAGMRGNLIIGTIKFCIGAAISFSIWWHYFNTSERVRNTYGPE